MSKWVYSQAVRDHFFNPRHVFQGQGESEFSGVGTVGNMACGDEMKIFLKVRDERIVDCQWKTFGCASAVASTSMLSCMVLENGGMTLNDALQITAQQIVRRLGGLPSQKVHCSVLGDQALKAAIFDHFSKSGQAHRIPENEQIVCQCKNLRIKDLQKEFAQGASSFQQVQASTGAGTACGKC